MASSIDVEFDLDLARALFSDLAPGTVTVFQVTIAESDSDLNSALSFTVPPLNELQFEVVEVENIDNTPLAMHLMAALPSAPDLSLIESDEDAVTPPSSENEKIDVKGTLLAEENAACDCDLQEGQEPTVVPAVEPAVEPAVTPAVTPVVEPTVTPTTVGPTVGVCLDPNKMRIMVIVSMVTPFGEGAETLVHAGDFLLEATPTTTIREIKQGITATLEIRYEDMALVFIGKFLSDARTIEYYFIDEKQTLHLLVESPNKLFQDIFEEFKRLNLSEERAWFATRSFIHILHNKYSVDGLGTDETPALTEEMLMQELEQIYVPGSDESDDSSAEEDEPDDNDANVVIVGGMELQFINDESESDEDEESDEEDQNSDDESVEDDDEEDEEENEDEDEDEVSDAEVFIWDNADYFTSQAIALYAYVE